MAVERWRVLKGTEVIGLTLAELLVLITFALLLVIGIFYSQLRQVQGPEIRNQTERLHDSTERVRQALLPDQPKPHQETMVGRIQTAADTMENLANNSPSGKAREIVQKHPMPEVWTTLVKGEEARNRLKDLKKKLAKATSKLEGDEKTSAVERVEVLERYAASGQKAMSRLEVEEPERLAKEAGNLRGQVENLKGRLKGTVHPPCWVSDSGGIEYVYEVTVLGGGFRVKPIWPEKREPDLKAIGGKLIRNERRVSPETFKSHMLPFYKAGQKADPECRFFVKVLDGTGPTQKQAWKRGLALVEQYFYKNLIDD